MESAALRERGDGWDYRSASRFKVTLSHPLEQGDRQECSQRVEAATRMNTVVQLPVCCLRNAAAGPPKIEPMP
jgi:hypothetical protein